MNWNIGDKFIIVDGTSDSLGDDCNGKMYTIVRLAPKNVDNGQFLSDKENYVWFYIATDTHHCCYVSKDNIIVPTKLHKALS